MQTANTYKDFGRRLGEEFLEQAIFLLETIAAGRNDRAFSWLDVADDEARLEAQLDGLVVCADAAVDLCRAALPGDEPAALDAALRVLCRLGRKDDVLHGLEGLGDGGAEALDAAAAALAAAAPQAWRDELAELALRRPRLIRAVAPAVARGGAAAELQLRALLDAAEASAAAPVLAALGRVGSSASLAAVEARIDVEQAEVSAAAAVAAWRLGADIGARLLSEIGRRPWLIVPAALGCGRAATRVLADRLADDAARPEALLALGLLGDLACVRALFESLADAEHAPAAAQALALITGAPLTAEVFVPDTLSADALFDDELEHLENGGAAPARADGTPFGTTELRLTTDPDVWREWLAANKPRFDPARRYRYGLPCSPAALLRTLEAERLPARVRTLVCDELKIRYGCSFPLAAATPVAEQRRLLERLRAWTIEHGRAFEPGVWCRAARPI